MATAVELDDARLDQDTPAAPREPEYWPWLGRAWLPGGCCTCPEISQLHTSSDKVFDGNAGAWVDHHVPDRAPAASSGHKVVSRVKRPPRGQLHHTQIVHSLAVGDGNDHTIRPDAAGEDFPSAKTTWAIYSHKAGDDPRLPSLWVNDLELGVARCGRRNRRCVDPAQHAQMAAVIGPHSERIDQATDPSALRVIEHPGCRRLALRWQLVDEQALAIR